MGAGMARALLRAGHRVVGCDLREEARDALAAAGARVVASPSELGAEVGIVVCVVVSAEQVEDVLFGRGGLASRLRRGALFVGCSTVAPEFAVATATRLAELGVGYLDAPISGGAVKAEAGALSVMASGPPAAFEQASAVLEATAENVFRMGDAVGLGSSMKMINQLLAGVHIAAAGEAVALGAKVGLEPQTVYDVICKSAGNSWMFENRVPRILSGDYKPHSAVEIFIKDLGIVLQTAGRDRFPTPLAAVAHQLFTMAASAGMGRWDDAAVAKVYQRLSDIELP
ncbi:MAG: NAD(P)-dependent oxidoreductase [Chromatiales bacterium]|nr:NAD(P)-dependent oxidoreductase [Chromatiales bacterium]